MHNTCHSRLPQKPSTVLPPLVKTNDLPQENEPGGTGDNNDPWWVCAQEQEDDMHARPPLFVDASDTSSEDEAKGEDDE